MIGVFFFIFSFQDDQIFPAKLLEASHYIGVVELRSMIDDWTD